jgi:hypothetical protein
MELGMRTLILACLFALPTFAQGPDAWKAASDAYKAERTTALKTFTPAELAVAEELFAKAEAAKANGNIPSALRLASEARWQVPFVPAGAPEHVLRILGAPTSSSLAVSRTVRTANGSRPPEVLKSTCGKRRPASAFTR